jgi:hypothetical protein
MGFYIGGPKWLADVSSSRPSPVEKTKEKQKHAHAAAQRWRAAATRARRPPAGAVGVGDKGKPESQGFNWAAFFRVCISSYSYLLHGD